MKDDTDWLRTGKRKHDGTFQQNPLRWNRNTKYTTNSKPLEKYQSRQYFHTRRKTEHKWNQRKGRIMLEELNRPKQQEYKKATFKLSTSWWILLETLGMIRRKRNQELIPRDGEFIRNYNTHLSPRWMICQIMCPTKRAVEMKKNSRREYDSRNYPKVTTR